MCGRYALTLPPEAVRAFFGYAEQPNFPPRYNIAPTQPVPVVTLDNGARRFTLMRWGFIPGWVKDLKAWPLVINVRSETAREKPAFRAAMTRRRCARGWSGTVAAGFASHTTSERNGGARSGSVSASARRDMLIERAGGIGRSAGSSMSRVTASNRPAVMHSPPPPTRR